MVLMRSHTSTSQEVPQYLGFYERCFLQRAGKIPRTTWAKYITLCLGIHGYRDVALGYMAIETSTFSHICLRLQHIDLRNKNVKLSKKEQRRLRLEHVATVKYLAGMPILSMERVFGGLTLGAMVGALAYKVRAPSCYCRCPTQK